MDIGNGQILDVVTRKDDQFVFYYKIMKMPAFIFIIVVVVVFPMAVDSATILMAAPQIRSHVIEQLALAEVLVARGHDVYMALGSRYPKRENVEKLGIRVITFDIPEEVPFIISDEFEKVLADAIFNSSFSVKLTIGRRTSQIVYRDCTYMMQDELFRSKISKIKFDLVIVESFHIAPCTLILPRYLQLPFVTMANFYHPFTIGNPVLPSVYPIFTTWTSASDVTFLERLKSLAVYTILYTLLSVIAPRDNTLLNVYAPEVHSWEELFLKAELFLVEVDHHLGNPVPAFPNFISVAGMTATDPKKLPATLESIVEGATEGVILVSFGSTAYYFPQEIVLKFLQVFAQLNQTVLAKIYVSDDVRVPENVRLLSWLPQNDILGHPKTRLFITHCGNNGQHEALYHGVPMIGFPLFAEQDLNCYRGKKRGFGLEMDIHDFTTDELLGNIRKVLYNPKYRSAIRKTSEIFRNQPLSSSERAGFWIEYAIKYGGRHLRSSASDLPLYKMFMLDILVVIIFVGFIFIISVRFLFSRFCRNFRKNLSSDLKLKKQ